MNYNQNGLKVKGFYDQTSVYPIIFKNGMNGLGIVNWSDLSLSFTVVTQKGDTLTTLVPPTSTYDGLFDAFVSLDVVGTTFNVEVRV